ncbi:MAG: flagellar hook-length control protein FliK, partial [Rhodocyclaceae bacterium]|nr:flagellar hook-length control protein FliK [Rhodocyclaceae bacterium]
QTAARQVIPERLAPIVHQQLESLATQNYLLQGMAWPGQKFEWEVEDEGHAAHGEEGELQEWKTTLRVTMPNMGGVEARVALTASGVSLRLVAEYDDTVDKLTQASAELAEALEAANVPLTGFIAEKLKDQPAPEPVEEGNDG